MHDVYLWAETYRGTIEDIFDIQEKVAGEIVQALQLRLSSDEMQILKKRFTRNTEAYQLYLQGRFFWNKRSETESRLRSSTSKQPSKKIRAMPSRGRELPIPTACWANTETFPAASYTQRLRRQSSKRWKSTTGWRKSTRLMRVCSC
jgi:hypothetical protein